MAEQDDKQLVRATFAGGCFWCMEPPFEKLPGMVSVTPGYTGGARENPTYEEVCSGRTGHAEAVEILFDPRRISYRELLRVFWRNIDPTTPNRQFADVGSQYRTAIFYHDQEQKEQAEASRQEMERSGKYSGPIVTEIVSAARFWPAEEYHRGYHRKEPLRYGMYRRGSGREGYLRLMWGDKQKDEG